MAEIGLYFSSSTGNCANIAERIAGEFEEGMVEIHDVMHGGDDLLQSYSYLIFGIPTWGLGELHSDWLEFLPKAEKIKFRSKKIALFGLGDQKTYSENFADSLGELHHWLIRRKAKIVGYWPSQNYSFMASKALINGKFAGLIIDEDTQSHLSEKRIKEWAEQLKNEFYEL
jgi:flavodoxin I